MATQDNPIAAVSDTLMNETYSSLSSASPSASTFSVDVASLAARATATTSSISSSTTTSATTTATPTSNSDDSITVAPGTIAGGVVGGVAGLAIIGILAWFLIRRRARKTHSYEPPSSPTAGEDLRKDGAASVGCSTPAPQYHLAEMDGYREISEVPGNGIGPREGPKELPSVQAEIRELPG